MAVSQLDCRPPHSRLAPLVWKTFLSSHASSLAVPDASEVWAGMSTMSSAREDAGELPDLSACAEANCVFEFVGVCVRQRAKAILDDATVRQIATQMTLVTAAHTRKARNKQAARGGTH